MMLPEIVVLLPCERLEDFPTECSSSDAASLLAAWTCGWLPAAVVSHPRLPRWLDVQQLMADPAPPPACYLVPSITQPYCEASEGGYAGLAERIAEHGGQLLAVSPDRATTLEQLRTLFPQLSSTAWDADFLALGYAYLQVELLTRQMRYGSTLDTFQFQSQLVAAAQAACSPDTPAASAPPSAAELPPSAPSSTVKASLQACFDLLTQQRDHYYPVDVYLLDVNLVEPSTLSGLAAQLDLPGPQNLLITGECLERLAGTDKAVLERLGSAVRERRVGLISPGQHAWNVPSAPPTALLADLAWGQQTCERLVGVQPTTYGRRVAGWSPLIPKLAQGLGYRAAWHTALDGSVVPAASQAKTMWEGFGGASLACCSKPPLDARDATTFLYWAAGLSRTMDSDHVAARTLVHWPSDASPYYFDLMRVAQWTPVLGKLVTWETFFSQSSDSGSWSFFAADEYSQGGVVGSQLPADPLSDSRRWWHDWLERLTASSLAAQAALLGTLSAPSDSFAPGSIAWWQHTVARWRGQLTAGDLSPSPAELASAVARGCGLLNAQPLPQPTPSTEVAAPTPSGSPRATGQVAINQFSWPRRTLGVDAPPSTEFAGEGTVYASGQAARGAAACWDLPATGFAVCRCEPSRGAAVSSKDQAIADGTLLRNEYLEAFIDPKTGAIQRLFDYRVRGNLCSQQIAVRLPAAPATGSSTYTQMQADRCELLENGSVRATVLTEGRLVDSAGHDIARFRQRISLSRGSRLLDMDLELEMLRDWEELLDNPQPPPSPHRTMSDLLEQGPYACVRLAWRDPTAELWRSVHLARQQTEASVFDGPLFCEILQDGHRVTLFTDGLPWHVRTSDRQLDTPILLPRTVSPSSPRDSHPAQSGVTGPTGHRSAGEPTDGCRVERRIGLGVGVEYPTREALAWMAPPVWLSLHEPTVAAQRGWLFHLDAKNVLAIDWEVLSDTTGSPQGIRVHLVETEGRYASTQLRTARPPLTARRVLLNGELERVLNVHPEGVELHLAPLDWIVVEVRWAT